MRNKKIFKAIPSVFAAAVMSVTSMGTALLALADGGNEEWDDGFVNTRFTETRDGFTVFANNKEEGGVTVTLDTAAILTREYFAIDLRVSYSLAEDGTLPVRFYVNDTLLKGSEAATLPVYDEEGNHSTVEMDADGYLALTGGFEGFVYFASDYTEGVSEISSVRAEFDGVHQGELTILNVFQCALLGMKPPKGEVEEADITVTTENGAVVADGFVLSYAGGEENGLIDAVFKTPAAFDSEYLVLDVTTTSEVHASFFVNGSETALGASSETISYLGKNAADAMNGVMQLEKSGDFIVLPANFNGVICFDKAEIGEIDEIDSLQIELDKARSAAFTVNGIHATDRLISYLSTDKASISETTVENLAGSNDHVVSISSPTSLFDRTANYLAVKFKMLTLASDTFTYLRFIVNGDVIAGDTDENPGTELRAYPADGSAYILLLHHWGNWIVIPEHFDGVIYIPMTQVALTKDPTLFGFGFDGGHQAKFEYAIGTADELGGACTWTDLSEGLRLVNLQSYRSPDVAGISTLSSFEANAAGKITDEAVVCDSGVSAFNNYSYSYETFGGVSLEEAWEDELVVHIKSQAEGGVPLNKPDNGDDFGNLEFDLGDNAFTMASGLAINVQCLSAECYFRVFVMDEDGHVWSADYTGSYNFVSDGVAVGMATQFFNFFFGEGSYGTLYIPKDRFVAENSYCGQPIPTGTAMGEITKIIFAFDMQYGLGRTMSVGAMANVDIENKTITRLFTPAQMTDAQLGIGTAQGTIVSCPGTDKHIANFTLRRVTEEEVPGADNSIADSGITLVAIKKEPVEANDGGCSSSVGLTLLPIAMLPMIGGVAAAIAKKRKTNNK